MLPAVVIAYFLTGLACIMWDFRKPYHDRPAYARSPQRYAKGFLVVMIGWLPLSLLEGSMSRMWGQAVKRIAAFAALIVGGAMMLK